VRHLEVHAHLRRARLLQISQGHLGAWMVLPCEHLEDLGRQLQEGNGLHRPRQSREAAGQVVVGRRRLNRVAS